jgi:hypothetical protein
MASRQETVLKGTNPKAFVDGLHIVSEETNSDGMKATIVVLWDIRYDPMFVPPEMDFFSLSGSFNLRLI